jgi:hypothetical protein
MPPLSQTLSMRRGICCEETQNMLNLSFGNFLSRLGPRIMPTGLFAWHV